MDTLEIICNGLPRTVPDGATLSSLLEELNLNPGQVAVEYNGRIFSQEEFGRVTLEAGARLELIRFVGGG